jgi:hypothetical protein
VAGTLLRAAGVTPTIDRRNATTFCACAGLNACDGIDVPGMPSRMIFATSSSEVARRNCLNSSTPVTPLPVSLWHRPQFASYSFRPSSISAGV